LRNFSFFYHIRGGGSTIRALQVSSFLEGRINPTNDYQNDTCIYVLGCMGIRGREVDNAYYDIIDCGTARLSRIRTLTRGSIITTSRTQHTVVKDFFKRRKMYLIPHHHCNFEREKRPERDIKIVGCMGGDSAVQLPHDLLASRLQDIGLDWRFSGYNSRDRQMVLDFYKGIDVHLTFRIEHKRNLLMHMNPLKLNNAGSFGIPSVSFPEPAYKEEWQDSCLWGENIDEIITGVQRLASDRDLYKEMSEKASAKAEEYHIDRIIPLYRELP